MSKTKHQLRFTALVSGIQSTNSVSSILFRHICFYGGPLHWNEKYVDFEIVWNW